MAKIISAALLLTLLTHVSVNADWTAVKDIYADASSVASAIGGNMLAAASGGKFVYIREGLRKEEVGEMLSEKFGWSEGQKLAFLSAEEGQYHPGTYNVPSSKDEVIMRELMLRRFEKRVEEPLASSTVVAVPVALKIASLIEREAGGKRDMRLISGIIWNRIFSGMTLDIDATIQYAKGREGSWWPPLVSGDTKLESPYNTYKNKGLPPTPISNAGLASIDAALNPAKTDCLFYLHDSRRRIHCARTYESHLRNISRYLK